MSRDARLFAKLGQQILFLLLFLFQLDFPISKGEGLDGSVRCVVASVTFRLGVENRKCAHNPARFVRRLREHNERVRFLSAEEEKRLREAILLIDPMRIAELDLALHTGMRKGEQYGLRWNDVDLTGRQLTLHRTKNGKVRHVDLNTKATQALQQLQKAQSGEFVFYNHRGERLRGPRFWWDKALRESGVENFHWHDLRHTFASRCVMKGVDLITLQGELGHQTLDMVRRYSHLSKTHRLAALERLCETDEGTGTTTGTGRKLAVSATSNDEAEEALLAA